MLKEIQNYDYVHSVYFDFEALCALLVKEQYALADEQIKILARQIDLHTLSFDADSYTRNIIMDKNYWLGLLNWDKGAKTRIHGHPQQAFVYVIKGRLNCKNFNKNPMLEIKNSILVEGEYRYSKGVDGRMDNYIHQINADEKTLSLHFYSDNPTKGEVFDF